jgi:hypothetical protein
MTPVLTPSKTRRFLSEAKGQRRYHRNAGRAQLAARGGVLWVPLGTGWSRRPEHVEQALRQSIKNQERRT